LVFFFGGGGGGGGGGPADLASLRKNLRARMRASPLMDEAGFTRELEKAYRAMWQGR
jgi:predicted O-linked N-acetylglucosamine transferase (SPINDLY family)